MKKLILVCGPAGIGKSTFCAKYISEHPDENVHIVASDEVRKDMCGSYMNFPPNKNMAPIYAEMLRICTELHQNNDDLTIMLDTTMLYDERRMFFVNSLPKFDTNICYLLKLHDWSLCLKRNKMRIKEKWVPEDVITDMISHYEDPSDEVKKHFAEVITYYCD